MGLDIRLPIGLLFSVVGLLLAAFGAFGDKAIYQRSLDVNVNLAWGLILLVFGIFMVALGKKRRSGETPSDSSKHTL